MREKLAVVGERVAGMAVVWRFLCDSRGQSDDAVTPDSCCLPAMHRGCVLVVAVVMVCDLDRRDGQGSGGEGWEHVGESRRMKDWGSGRRGHVVVVVSVWSWLSVLLRFFLYGTFYVWVAVTHGLVDTERTHVIYLIM